MLSSRGPLHGIPSSALGNTHGSSYSRLGGTPDSAPPRTAVIAADPIQMLACGFDYHPHARARSRVDNCGELRHALPNALIRSSQVVGLPQSEVMGARC